ncbi:hypothetical protein DFH06DRAFT_1193312 [Mycena polygramma]|nr:hypothetical protein DFH06DRAFT_1193312 [Mycena polygramma]
MSNQHISSPHIRTRSPDPASLARGRLRTRLTQLDAEIEDLQTRLNQLTTARNSVLDSLNSIVYPILTLPNEITTEIFLNYVSDYPLRLPESYRQLAGPPLLASVCRSWRHVALHLPAIWSNITVNSDFTTTMLLQCCLARAKARPLALNTDLEGSNAEVFVALAAYSMQWEIFECDVILPLLFSDDGVRGRTPILKKLVVSRHGGRSNDVSPLTAFSEAPQLREVDLEEMSTRSISLPWAQLTQLTCRSNNSVEIAEMLHLTTRLEKLVLFNLYSSPGSAPAPPICLHYLHTLELLYITSLDVLDRFTLPALKTLALEGSSALLPTLLQFFARSAAGHELRSVSMTDVGLSFVDQVLAAVPGVINVQLCIHRAWLWDEHLIPLLQRCTTDAEFLPNLETLSVEWYTRAVPAQVVEMLEARWGGGSRKLKSFKLRCRSKSWHEVDELNKSAVLRARLQALIADGLEVELPGM